MSQKDIVSEGGDFVIEQVSRLDRATRLTAFKVDGTSGQASFGIEPALPGISGEVVVAIPVLLKNLTLNAIAARYKPLFPGHILKVEFQVVDAPTTGGKDATIRALIGATTVTGAIISLTTANATPNGTTIAGTAVTGLSAFNQGGVTTDEITLKATAVASAFTEGQGVFFITLGQ